MIDLDAHTILTAVFAFIIAFAVLAYVAMDGFDLGLAILFPFFPDRADRNVMMNSVAPVWDGNETWLVLGGGGLFAAFPLGYAVLMPALYTPLIAMLLGLVFRGVAFEFRWRNQKDRNVWDLAFFGGSLVAALAQGIALGAVLQGVQVSGRAYGGGWWDWLSPFSLLTGAATVAAYTLLGATWLVMKTTGSLQKRSFMASRISLIITLVFIVAVSLATPFLQGHYWERWFTFPSIVLTAPVPIAVAIFAIGLLKSLERRSDHWPFILALALFLVTFGGLGVSIWPYVVPEQITIWQAAAPETSQRFLIFGVAILIPIVLAYTAYAYWVFRGKVDTNAGYHS
jgi:cytochrome d ubiquinol oxidase subunit II